MQRQAKQNDNNCSYMVTKMHATIRILLLMALPTPVAAFAPYPLSSSLWSSKGLETGSIGYKSETIVDDSFVPGPSLGSRINESFQQNRNRVFISRPLPVHDPANVAFESSDSVRMERMASMAEVSDSAVSFSAVMEGSAPYIAAHAGKTAVFHIPVEILEKEKDSDNLFSDIALAWLLGMKPVLVIGNHFDSDNCDLSMLNHPHECHNLLKVTDSESVRQLAEEAGYLRTEVERKLNRFLPMHGLVSSTPGDESHPEGNVVSGNFYCAQRFGMIGNKDFLHTGFTSGVHTEKIQTILDNNDIVLLSTVGVSNTGDLVNVNGYHLAASVAASLGGYKLIYMANQGSVLSENGVRIIQDLPLSYAREIIEYHKVHVHHTGFATFESARRSLEPKAVELLLHLGWASWALEHGVQRAHVVNPGDGALMEELFTCQNGANTCLFHDNELEEFQEFTGSDDLDEFFAASAAQGQDVPSFV